VPSTSKKLAGTTRRLCPRLTPLSTPIAPLPVRDPSSEEPAGERDLLEMGRDSLSRLERAQIRFVRASLRPGRLDQGIRMLQRSVGQWWIRAAIAKLRHVHGLDRVPAWDESESLVLVANHRSFFDLYVTTAELVAHGLPQRILFPVRSTFFYDHPLGPIVNGAMSFFAMYPPVFRDRKRAALNVAGLDEVAVLLRRGGFFVGVHPEGTRKKDGDPYTFLPPQSGIGRLIRRARATVLPVFVNGLGNDLPKQIVDGIRGKGTEIHVVYGAPVDFGGMLDAQDGLRTYKRIAERCIEAIAELAQEERAFRARSRLSLR
jgi:1-acyl-sn-glycerol-3-phosphate acyltransferase